MELCEHILTGNHNLGRLSDTVHHTLADAVSNRFTTSFMTNVWIEVHDKQVYLSHSFKERKPVIGNRLCKDTHERMFYLQLNEEGKLLNKIRV